MEKVGDVPPTTTLQVCVDTFVIAARTYTVALDGYAVRSVEAPVRS